MEGKGRKKTAMRTYWKSAMLAEILFMENGGMRIAIAMVQANGPRWQPFGIYAQLDSVPCRPLGFYESADEAKRVAEHDARLNYPELRHDEMDQRTGLGDRFDQAEYASAVTA